MQIVGRGFGFLMVKFDAGDVVPANNRAEWLGKYGPFEGAQIELYSPLDAWEKFCGIEVDGSPTTSWWNGWSTHEAHGLITTPIVERLRADPKNRSPFNVEPFLRGIIAAREKKDRADREKREVEERAEREEVHAAIALPPDAYVTSEGKFFRPDVSDRAFQWMIRNGVAFDHVLPRDEKLREAIAVHHGKILALVKARETAAAAALDTARIAWLRSRGYEEMARRYQADRLPEEEFLAAVVASIPVPDDVEPFEPITDADVGSANNCDDVDASFAAEAYEGPLTAAQFKEYERIEAFYAGINMPFEVEVMVHKGWCDHRSCEEVVERFGVRVKWNDLGVVAKREFALPDE